MQLVHDRLGIKLPIRTVGEYLKRWGFTPQKPIKKAYEQRPAEVKKWLDEEYPQIAARAKAEQAEIHWGDETGLRSDDVRGRGYAPNGHTPVVRVNNKREGLSIISTVTNRGKVRWKIFEGAMHADLLIDFFKRLIKDADRKVFLILDNLKVHHARKVKAWLADHEDGIEVFYLPSYSPELNPDECLNADLKDGVTRRAPARSKGQLKKAAISHLRKLREITPTRPQVLRAQAGSLCCIKTFHCRVNNRVSDYFLGLGSRLKWSTTTPRHWAARPQALQRSLRSRRWLVRIPHGGHVGRSLRLAETCAATKTNCE